jgi:hypothetical protein
MKLIVLILVCFLALSLPVHAKPQVFIGAYKALKDTQDSDGKVAEKPFSPAIAIGYNFNLFDTGFGFSPHFGYIHTKVTANDSYGKQKIHTLFFNWDFLYVPEIFPSMAVRFGVGNFLKRTSGEGGTVEIPNGNGTDEARRPDETRTSYTSTFNLGADFNFELPLNDWFTDLGLRTEMFIFRPLSKENRNYAFILGLTLFF